MQLYIRNFQNIKEATIDLEGFVVFTGRSNSGKSTVVRALDLLFYNVWDKGHLRLGAEECMVKLTIDHENWIQLTKPENTYTVCLKGEKSTYLKVGKATLAELSDLGMDKFIDSEGYEHSVHLRHQTDPWFYISQGKQEQSRIIASIFNFDQIKNLIKVVYTDRAGVNQRLNNNLEAIDSLKVELVKYEGEAEVLTQLEKRLIRKSRLCAFLDLSSERSRLTSLESEACSQLSLIDRVSNSLDLLSTLNIWQSHSALCDELKTRCSTISSDIQSTSNKIQIYTDISNRYESMSHIQTYFEVMRNLIDKQNRVNTLSSKIIWSRDFIDTHSRAYDNMGDRVTIKTHLSKLSEFTSKEYELMDLDKRLGIVQSVSNKGVRLSSLERYSNNLQRVSELQKEIKSFDHKSRKSDDVASSLSMALYLMDYNQMLFEKSGKKQVVSGYSLEIDSTNKDIKGLKGELDNLMMVYCPECGCNISDLVHGEHND